MGTRHIGLGHLCIQKTVKAIQQVIIRLLSTFLESPVIGQPAGEEGMKDPAASRVHLFQNNIDPKENDMSSNTSKCAQCPFESSQRLCRTEDGKAPPFCPTLNMQDLVDQSLKEYTTNPDLGQFTRMAALQEADGYANRDLGYERVRASKTRIEEIIEFADKMDYKRLGMAFCLGLRKEAKIVERIIASRGFEVVSVVCKAGGLPKELIGIRKEEQIDPTRTEVMCNPVLQALVLNRENTEFNVLLGLCVGHDSLFFKYSEAPCTVLAVKDRLLGHNPLAAIYNYDGYYRCLKKTDSR